MKDSSWKLDKLSVKGLQAIKAIREIPFCQGCQRNDCWSGMSFFERVASVSREQGVKRRFVCCLVGERSSPEEIRLRDTRGSLGTVQ